MRSRTFCTCWQDYCANC